VPISVAVVVLVAAAADDDDDDDDDDDALLFRSSNGGSTSDGDEESGGEGSSKTIELTPGIMARQQDTQRNETTQPTSKESSSAEFLLVHLRC